LASADNAIAESFFASLESESYYRRVWPTKAQASLNDSRSCSVLEVEGCSTDYNNRSGGRERRWVSLLTKRWVVAGLVVLAAVVVVLVIAYGGGGGGGGGSGGGGGTGGGGY